MMIHVDLIWKHLNLGALTRKSVALSVIIAAAKVSSSYQWLGASMDRFEIFKYHRIEDHRRPWKLADSEFMNWLVNWFGRGYWGDCRSQWIETYIGGSDHFPSNFGLGSRRSFQEESGVKAAWKKTSMIPRASKIQTNRSRYIKIIYHIPPKRSPPPSFSPDDFRKVPVLRFPIAKLNQIDGNHQL